MQKIFIFISLLLIANFLLAQNQENYIKEGNEFFRNGQLAEAVLSYEKVTDEPFKYTALFNKGTALYKQKRFDEAVKAYQQVSASKTASMALKAGAYYNSGVVYSKKNKIEESIEAFKAALRLNPEDDKARENLQKALSELKKGGGGGTSSKPKNAQPSKLSKNEARQQLDRLEQKEKKTQSKVANKKTPFSGSVGKDW